MDKPDRKTLLIALGMVLILGLGVLLSFYIIWKEKELDIGYSKEALEDPFLAIKRFLEKQQVGSQTLRSFMLLDTLSWQDQQLGADDTLILFNAHKMLHGERLDNLLAWVGRGGTVIVSTDNLFMGTSTDTRDPLLEHFELEVQDGYVPVDVSGKDEASVDEADEDYKEDIYKEAVEPDEEYSPGEKSLNDEQDSAAADDTKKEAVELPGNHFRCNLDSPPLAVDFDNESEPLLIDYSEGSGFDYYGAEPQNRAGDEHGLHMARFDWGEGLVVINSDNRLWENERVDCHDHAYALWKLINHNGKVWFLVNQEAPSLWTMLWRAAPYGALAALSALAFWLWAKASRFGPILTHASSGRRSLAEHIHASAMLLWRRQEHPYLVTLLRDELRQQLQQHYPQFKTWSAQEQIAHLQSLTSLSATQLHQALFSDRLLYPQDFTEAVACLQTIRKNL